MLSPIYSSGSSSKPAPSAISSSCLTLKQSLIYFRKQVRVQHFYTRQHQGCHAIRLRNPITSARWFSLLHLLFCFFAMVVYKSKTPSLSLRGRPKPIRQRRSFVCYLFLFFRSLAQLLFQSQR